MKAWFEANRLNTFSNVGSEDVVFRSAYLTNSLILGNGLLPNDNAAMYIASNCIGVHRVPALGADVVLDVGGGVACRSSLTWSHPTASPAEVVSGSNGIRASAAGMTWNNGSVDTLTLGSSGIQTAGTLYASNAHLGHHTGRESNLDVLTVMGRGLFDDGVCLVADPRETRNASLVYDSSDGVLSLGSRMTVGTHGLLVDGTIVSTGLMFAPGYKVLSDVRLKRDIAGSDRHSDLMDVMAVDVKRYTLAADNSGKRHIGVLAHDLSAIMPDAVSLVDDYLPDVMASAQVQAQTDTGTWVVFPSNQHVFRVGDNLRVTTRSPLATFAARVKYVDGRDCICVSAKALQDTTVGSELFVYGTLCHDIMAVDTTHVLFRLVSAVQSLHSGMEEVRRDIEDLRTTASHRPA